MSLSRQCSATLEEAEKRVEILVADRPSDAAGDEDPEILPFDFDEDEDDDSGEDPEDMDPEE